MGIVKKPIFVSIVICVKNNTVDIKKVLKDTTNYLSGLVSDYELIVVDNASLDNNVEVFKGLTSSQGLPNLQVYLLTKEVDRDIATWAGLENALGDFVVVFNPAEDDLSVLPEMLEKAVAGNDVVFAYNQIKPKQTMSYRIANGFFNFMYKRFNGIDLPKDAPEFRVLSKSIINFILQHNQPAISYRLIPVTAGFAKSYIEYKSQPKKRQIKKLSYSIERGIKLMVSTSRLPMRFVTFLSLFGACANLIYSFYVMFIWFFKESVAPGWVSSSLQMSGMFLLISLVLLVLGEYILHMASLSNEEPKYHVGQEFTSAKMTRLEKLNLEDIKPTEKQGT
jgi:glycosyltransferase involved in cell wall biosynthesis